MSDATALCGSMRLRLLGCRGRGGDAVGTFKTIARAAHGLQVTRRFSVVLDLFANAPDIHIDGTWCHKARIAPHGIQQLVAAEDSSRVPRQVVEQAELGRGGGDQLAADTQLHGATINLDLADAKRFCRFLPLKSAQHGFHTRQQFAGAEGLGDVIVRAQLQTVNPVAFTCQCGQKDHRDHAEGGIGAQTAAQIQPISTGHHDVQQEERRDGQLCRRQHLTGVCKRLHGVACVLQVVTDQLGDVRIVFQQEDGLTHVQQLLTCALSKRDTCSPHQRSAMRTCRLRMNDEIRFRLFTSSEPTPRYGLYSHGAMSFSDWLLADLRVPTPHKEEEAQNPWWRVMCLTGVDYFSTLGYQPGIAFLAAGVLSPLATFVLVLVTLFAALPVYSRVCKASPYGQGSIAMLQRLFPAWYGKIFVLVLLGFATTDFIITMTLSAADGAAHLIHNPLMPHWVDHQMIVTLLILAILSGIFLKGFKEAVNIAVWLVGIYLLLNAVVVVAGVLQILHHPEVLHNWRVAISARPQSKLGMFALALLLFPKLALGLSGFETGVAVMPLIAAKDIEERVRNAKRLLITAAVIMSVFLMATSVITTVLIPAKAFQEGGDANGRAMAWLAHHYTGNVVGTAYDISTILILGFAGASAMAGLLNLIPRYLPKFGMAPEWARASRPLVLVFMGIATVVTVLFRADVDAQGGAYATGVLVLITSASVAVMLSVWGTRLRWAFIATSAIFTYTTLANIVERPEGLKISSIFIGCILLSSFISRALRSTELRITEVQLDAAAEEILSEVQDQVFRLVARGPEIGDSEGALDISDRKVRYFHSLSEDEHLLFFEVTRTDASEFSETLCVTGRHVGRHRVLSAKSPVVANAIAGMLVYLSKRTGQVPHVYFRWTEVSPALNIMRFLFLGEGDTAPLTHEVLRKAIPQPENRPVVHVS